VRVAGSACGPQNPPAARKELSCHAQGERNKCRDFLNPEQSLAQQERGYVEIGPGPFQRFFGAPREDSERGRRQLALAASCFGFEVTRPNKWPRTEK
jgi:hypothetical protein